MNDKRTCLECGDLVMGRIDKKFCSDQCRNTYNNILNRDEINMVRNTNRILRKNRRILNLLNPDGKANTTWEKLLQKGFNFNYITSYYQTRRGNVYYYCYDQGYIKTRDKYYALVCREEYLE